MKKALMCTVWKGDKIGCVFFQNYFMSSVPEFKEDVEDM